MSGLNTAVRFTPAGGYTYGQQEQGDSDKVLEEIPSEPSGPIDHAEVLSMHKALHSTFQTM